MAKILQIIPSLDKINGGVERGTVDVAKQLVKLGFESSIISSGGEMAEKYKYRGVNHYKLNLKEKGLINYFLVRRKIKTLLSEIRPDIVHLRSRWPAFCLIPLLKKFKIPVVTTYHGTYSGNNFFLKKKYNSVMISGEKVITISKFIDDHVRFYFPSVKSKLVQINRGIDTEYFNLKSVAENRKEKLISSFALSEKTHVILLPARITSWKGHLVAINAAYIITQKAPSLNFIILFVGDSDDKGSHLKKIQSKIKKLNLDNKIIFCGNLSDMPAVYSIADVVLSTSIEPEAFGRVSAEASSMTKPIISSNHGGSREIIEDGMTGWLIEPSNPEKLANKIIEVINLSQSKKDSLGANARRRIKQKFSLENMLNKTLSVYEELLSTKKSFNN